MSEDSLILEKKNYVAVVTLNRPAKLNAIDASIRERFPELLAELQNDDEVRAVIITGAGRGFCSGADVAAQAARKNEEQTRKTRLKLVGDLIQAFVSFDKPIISAVNGIAAGVGLSIALASDVRIASTEGRFSAIWVKRGLVADGAATLLLPLAVGMEKALELCMTGEVLDAAEAERIRLVSKVVPHEELLDHAHQLADKFAAMPPISVELHKRLIWERIRGQLHEQLMLETYAQNVCRGSSDHKEAVNAFLEKRSPVFTGA